MNGDWTEIEEAVKRRAEIERSHAWVYRCFPPRPTVCAICGADRSDPNLGYCTFR